MGPEDKDKHHEAETVFPSGGPTDATQTPPPGTLGSGSSLPDSEGEPDDEPRVSASDATVVPGAGVGASDATVVPGAGGTGDETIVGGDGGGKRMPGPGGGLPQRIGLYRLKRLLGQGGMGAVYEAEQDNPRRDVALKVMKAGLTSRSAMRRFEYEAEILARLRHPGIAAVYEAGTHDDGEGGVPFFAMEFVAGAQILTDFVETKNISTRDRLELFLDICDAIHHGHQKGIIHRDLKPANILVDGQGKIKIIDFGIARVTDSDTQSVSIQTQVGELIGTVQYMSPEQVEANPNDIDVRSDVYALGLVLYEMLVGRLPYDLTNVALWEATKLIREKPPTPMAPIKSELRGDIETIVLKALEKERDRRYQSANALRNDIERYLKDQPIAARPPSVTYQFSRFAKRNKTLVGGVAAVFIAFVGGFVGTTTMYFKSQRNLATANATLGGLQAMFTNLDDRRGAGPQQMTVGMMLDNALGEVIAGLSDQPAAEAEVRWAVAIGYKALSRYADSEKQFRLALARQRDVYDAPHEKIAQTLYDLSGAVWFNGTRAEEAAELAGESLEMRIELFGEDSEQVADAKNFLATFVSRSDKERAETLFRETLATRQTLQANWDEKHPDEPRDFKVAAAMNNLANFLKRQEAFDEAKRLFRGAVDLTIARHGPVYGDVARGQSNLARFVAGLGNVEEAEQLFQQSLATKKTILGDRHASYALTEYYYAGLLLDEQRFDEAEERCRVALAIQEEKLPPADRSRIRTQHLLARLLIETGRVSEAAPVCDTLLEIQHDVDRTNRERIVTDQLHAAILLRNDRNDEALTVIEGLREVHTEEDHGATNAARLRTTELEIEHLARTGRMTEAAAMIAATRAAIAADPGMQARARQLMGARLDLLTTRLGLPTGSA